MNNRQDLSFGIVPISRRSDGDYYLLVQHRAGHWGFPKGHAEAGETPEAAACREFEEETGIYAYECLSVSFTEQYSFIKAGKPFDKTVTYFPAFVRSEAVVYQEKEIKDYAWLTYAAALEILTFAQAKQVLVQVQEYLKATLKSC